MSTPTALHNAKYPDAITDPSHRGDTRNVIDHYKGWASSDIADDLAVHAFPLIVVLENFAHDFNIGTGVRNANAFGASNVVILGRGTWDRRGAVGTHHYTPVEKAKDAAVLYAGYRDAGYSIVAVDNVPGAVTLAEHTWDPKTVLVFGQEDIGVSNLTLGLADACVSIPMFGSVRSLNVGTASGILLHDYAVAAAAAK